jgi:hypothetical protein
MGNRFETHRLVAAILLLLPLCYWAIWAWRKSFARKRHLAAIKSVSEIGQNEIAGQPFEYWLNILNQDRSQPIIPYDTFVLKYKGQEFFFIDGAIDYIASAKDYKSQKSFFLIAVGQSAVELLSAEEPVFRLITGAAELAVFSIYRLSDFAYMLMAERKYQIGIGRRSAISSD